ncbi:hypothetical protein LRU_01869 [Ligilactobacillus ruminis SPM0211]|uniref:Uncharacterized protein n=1 Tax=Ligilactobacillus ruminis SPM0211 TaxID=1040964 RepID=F7R2E9_9LACO|nr:hypothetical protein LRU_01869 [Ligilactobacillus ruminis SPM0211]
MIIEIPPSRTLIFYQKETLASIENALFKRNFSIFVTTFLFRFIAMKLLYSELI